MQILQMHTFRAVKDFLAALTEAVVLLGKQERKISQGCYVFPSCKAGRLQHQLAHCCSYIGVGFPAHNVSMAVTA